MINNPGKVNVLLPSEPGNSKPRELPIPEFISVYDTLLPNSIRDSIARFSFTIASVILIKEILIDNFTLDSFKILALIILVFACFFVSIWIYSPKSRGLLCVILSVICFAIVVAFL